MVSDRGNGLRGFQRREVLNIVNRQGIRWTVGDVSDRGFEALRLSAWGARRCFGPEADYVICVNSIPLDVAVQRAGPMPLGIEWIGIRPDDLPDFIRARVDASFSGGVAWKFAPVRLFPDRYEISLDNDVVLWKMPACIERWLAGGRFGILAEDVRRSLGSFDAYCGTGAWNSGIRGLPPGLDYASALRDALESHDVVLRSELDEQGLQVVAMMRCTDVDVVTVDEVSICSPIPPHHENLGACGAHFVGLNARSMSWGYGGAAPTDLIARHWDGYLPLLQKNVGISEPALSAF